MQKIVQFRYAAKDDYITIKEWLRASHVVKFWDNSMEFTNNLKNFINGDKNLYDYWVGSFKKVNHPFCLLVTSDAGLETPDYFLSHMPSKGKAWTIDFLIGDVKWLGCGLAALTLRSFMDYLASIDLEIKTFIIDPAEQNKRAIRVYYKAGFQVVGGYIPNCGYFSGIQHLIMIR